MRKSFDQFPLHAQLCALYRLFTYRNLFESFVDVAKYFRDKDLIKSGGNGALVLAWRGEVADSQRFSANTVYSYYRKRDATIKSFNVIKDDDPQAVEVWECEASIFQWMLGGFSSDIPPYTRWTISNTARFYFSTIASTLQTCSQLDQAVCQTRNFIFLTVAGRIPTYTDDNGRGEPGMHTAIVSHLNDNCYPPYNETPAIESPILDEMDAWAEGWERRANQTIARLRGLPIRLDVPSLSRR